MRCASPIYGKETLSLYPLSHLPLSKVSTYSGLDNNSLHLPWQRHRHCEELALQRFRGLQTATQLLGDGGQSDCPSVEPGHPTLRGCESCLRCLRSLTHPSLRFLRMFLCHRIELAMGAVSGRGAHRLPRSVLRISNFGSVEFTSVPGDPYVAPPLLASTILTSTRTTSKWARTSFTVSFSCILNLV